MTIGGVISALAVGLVIGVLARLILPGRQPIGLIVTVLVGILAALLGTWLTDEIGWGERDGFDFIEFVAQLVLAIIGVALVSALLRGRART